MSLHIKSNIQWTKRTLDIIENHEIRLTYHFIVIENDIFDSFLVLQKENTKIMAASNGTHQNPRNLIMKKRERMEEEILALILLEEYEQNF